MIEPCLYCGGEMVESVIGDFRCLQCGAWVQYGDVQTHNSLSRIVRAAEEYHRIRSLSLMSGHLYNDPLDRQAERRAIRAVFDAVEGGAE